MASTASIPSQEGDLALTMRLPDVTYDELVDLDKPSDPVDNKLPPTTGGEAADLAQWGHEEETYNAPPFCYGTYARFDNNRYSKEPRIDGVTIPPHLVNMIQRDQYDLAERENPKVAVRLGYEYRDPDTSNEDLIEFYRLQNSGKGKVEVVFYSRKREVSDSASPVPSCDDGMDARGRHIDRIVWPSNRQAAVSRPDTSPAKRQRTRSPTPVREPVFQRAAKYCSESTTYQSYSDRPAPEPVDYNQTILFTSHSKHLKYPKISKRMRRRNLHMRQYKLAGEQAELRKERGGLMIDLEERLRRNGTSLGRVGKVTDAYATAFETWDDTLAELKGYAESNKRRAWCRTMWEMPAKGRVLRTCSPGDGDKSGGESWLDDEWEVKPV